MAITAIPNQSIAFQASRDINRPGEHTFRQLVNQADVLAVEVALTEYNGDNRVQNGNFNASTGWTFGSGWSYDATNDEADASSASGDLTGTVSLTAGYFYRTNITVKNYVGGELQAEIGVIPSNVVLGLMGENGTFTAHRYMSSNGSGIDIITNLNFTGSIDDVEIITISSVGLRIVNEAGSVVWSDYLNTNGYVTYLAEDLLENPTPAKAKIQFTWSALSLSNGCYRLEIVDTAEVLEDSALASNLDSVLQSQYFMVETSHDDTIMLSWTNDKNFNVGNSVVIDYDNFTYTQYMRVRAMLGNMIAEKTKTIYVYGDGDMKLAAATNTERRTLFVDNLPDYAHEALMVAVDHDKFYINGNRYFCDQEEYTPAWRRKSNLAPVTLEVLRQYGQQQNNNC